MSTTIAAPTVPTSAAANLPKQSIVTASSAADVVRAMIDDPAIKSSILNAFTTFLASKSALSSKTIWVAVLAPIILSITAHFGGTLQQAEAVDFANTVMGVAMIVMRLLTTTPISGVITAAPAVPVINKGP
jgi:uncharacterized membrane protein